MKVNFGVSLRVCRFEKRPDLWRLGSINDENSVWCDTWVRRVTWLLDQSEKRTVFQVFEWVVLKRDLWYIIRSWKLNVMWHMRVTCAVTPGPVWLGENCSYFRMSRFEKRPGPLEKRPAMMIQWWEFSVMWHMCVTCDVTPGPVWEHGSQASSSFRMSLFEKTPVMIIQDSDEMTHSCDTTRSREDETRNSERNANRYPEWWRGDFSQLVKIEKIKFLGISR